MRLPTGNKQQEERRIFDVLAALIGLHVVPGTVRQGSPPWPDIECEIVDLGPLAVELVALDDKQTRTRIANMLSTKRAWAHALSGQSLINQVALLKECCDMDLYVEFNECAGLRDRQCAMQAIQVCLLEKASGYAGALFADLARPAHLHSATVYRDSNRSSDGPRIYTHSGGSWQPPQIDKIKDKLTTKHYKTLAPLDLFAYSIHDEPDGAVGMIEKIDDCVQAHIAASGFRKVHIFNFAFKKHIRTYLR